MDNAALSAIERSLFFSVANQNVHCVALSVRVQFMCCGSVSNMQSNIRGNVPCVCLRDEVIQLSAWYILRGNSISKQNQTNSKVSIFIKRRDDHQ